MLAGIRELGMQALPFTPELRQWQARVLLCLHAAPDDREPWPDVSDGALLATLSSPRFLRADPPGSRGRSLSMIGLIAGLQQLVPEISARSGEPAQTPVCRMFGDLLPLTIHKA